MANYERFLLNEADQDPLNVRVNASLNGTIDELPDKFEFWNKDAVREAVEGLQRADRAAQDRVENQKIGDAFVAGHPEYKDTNANAALMTHELNRMFGPGLHPLEHYEKAYESLRSSNFLALDQAELKKQQKAAAKQRFEQERSRSVTPSEQELYDMPLDDLRRLDAIENQKRLQLAGERGGNDW